MTYKKNLTTVEAIIQKAVSQGLFPGAALGIAFKNEYPITLYHGRHTFVPWARKIDENSLFDLASVTKPLCTTLAAAKLVESGKLSLDQTLDQFFKHVPPDKRPITIEHLLTHSSGLCAWTPIYEHLYQKKPKNAGDRLETACRFILHEPLCNPLGEKPLYSDLGFILLGRILEAAAGRDLWSFAKAFLYEPMGLSSITVSENRDGPVDLFVPSGYCPVRQSMNWGRVHDLNAWAIGNVPGHAGLFSNLADVLDLTVQILRAYSGKKSDSFPIGSETIRQFLDYRSLVPENLRALGFDRPSLKDSTCGGFFSPKSVGHLGYTGTSFWIDLEAGISVVFLSARTFPFDTPRKRKAMNIFRQQLHNEIRKSLAPWLQAN